MTKQSILAFLLLLLVACHNARQVPGTAPVYYSDERSVSLLPTASMTEKLDMPQHIVGEFHKPDGSTDSFEADSWVRANDSFGGAFFGIRDDDRRNQLFPRFCESGKFPDEC